MAREIRDDKYALDGGMSQGIYRPLATIDRDEAKCKAREFGYYDQYRKVIIRYDKGYGYVAWCYGRRNGA